MLHCVPEWDVSGGDLDVVLEPTDLFVPSKGRWEQSRKCNSSETPFVSDFEFEELCWEDGELVVVQGLSSKGSRNRSCLTNASDRLALPLETCTTTGITAADVGGTLDKDVTGGVIDSFANNSCAQEDELMTWMQHLIDDPPEKYGSDVPSESPNPNMWNACDKVYSRDSVHHLAPLNTMNSGHCSTASASRTSRIDVSSSHTSQTTMGEGQGNAFKQTDGVLPGSGIKGSTPCASNSSKTSLEYGPTLRRPQMPPPEVQQVISSSAFAPFVQAGSPSLLNFSNFSRPAAAIKANLHSIGMASGPTGTERVKQLDRVAVGASNCESIESGTKDASLTAAEGQEDAFVSASSIPRSAGTSSVHHPVQSLSSREEADPAMSAEDVDGNFKVVDISHGWNSCVTSSAAPGTDRSTAALEAAEPIFPCYSGGSGNTAGKSGKGAGGGGKRKVHDGEDSECQSKDPEDESADGKKPTSGPSNFIKKSRAAEIHNQSERRRRDRINEKMKALQELIPNCNKTDKASLLEEAIEYVKSLQTQLQMMSYRSGMSLSPLVMPQGVQHMQMAQMVPLPHMHMGMGMGLVDMTVGIPGRHILPMPSLSTTPFTCPVMPVPVPTVPPSTIPVSAFPISEVSWPGVSPPGHQVLLPVRPATIPGAHEPLHTSNMMSQNLYLTPQQHHPAQVMNKSMYNTFIAYQHQLPQPSNFIMANRPLQ